MSANRVFVQALADACARPVEVSPQLEATTLGAGLLAGLAAGVLEQPRRRGRDLVAPIGRRAVGAARRPRPLAPGDRTGRPVVPGTERTQFLMSAWAFKVRGQLLGGVENGSVEVPQPGHPFEHLARVEAKVGCVPSRQGVVELVPRDGG